MSDTVYTEDEQRTVFTITRHHGLVSTGHVLELTRERGWVLSDTYAGNQHQSTTNERAVAADTAARLAGEWKHEAQARP